MSLQRKILDANQELFANSAVDELITKLGGKSSMSLTDIERRQLELDERQYALAEMHRKMYDARGLDPTQGADYVMPGVASDSDGETKDSRRLKALTRRYETEEGKTEQEQWEAD